MRADSMPPDDAPLDIDRLMRDIRADVAARLPDATDGAFGGRVNVDGDAADTSADNAGRPVRLSRIGAFSMPLPRKPAYRVDDFLAYHDEDFIRNAYRALLGREPDAEGATRYLARLRSGQLSRIEVLGRIHHSPEGKAAGVRVEGLLVPFAVRTARRVPVLGRLLGIVQYLWRLPDLARNHEVLESAVFENRAEVGRRIDGTLSQIEQVFAAARAAQAGEANRLEARIRETQAQALAIGAGAQARSDQLDRTIAEMQSAAQARDAQLGAALDDARAHAERAFAELHTQLTAASATAGALAARLDSVAADVVKGARTVDALRDGNQVLGQQLAQLAAVSDFASRVAAVERAAADLSRLAKPQPLVAIDEPIAMPEGFYVAFEDRFRGTRDDIKARTEVYLPLLHDAGAGSAEAPVLDIGCGRGEWLELLQERGLHASGVDVNDVAVAGCTARGLAVLAGDGIEHLRRLAPDSLGAVSAIHVIEHLPFARLLALFDEVRRVLRPGGIAIFETPNPENLIVGACNFYYDPTHQRPLPPEPFRFILEARGFTRVEIMRLHPDASVPDLGALPRALADTIAQRLFGPQDYALIGFKAEQGTR